MGVTTVISYKLSIYLFYSFTVGSFFNIDFNLYFYYPRLLSLSLSLLLSLSLSAPTHYPCCSPIYYLYLLVDVSIFDVIYDLTLGPIIGFYAQLTRFLYFYFSFGFDLCCCYYLMLMYDADLPFEFLYVFANN